MAITLADKLVNNIPKGYVAPSRIHGLGLFAREFIEMGEVVGELGGKPLLWRDMAKHGLAHYVDHEWNALANGLLLIRTEKTKYAAINHSRTPNLEVQHPHCLKQKVLVVAIRGICMGEEMTLDYRQEPLPPEYWAEYGGIYL